MNLACFDKFPVIETERLQLRELLEADAVSVFAVFQSPEVTKFYDVETMTEVASAAAMIARLRQRYAERGGIRWAVIDREHENFVGTIGINSINVFAHKAVVGYEISRASWGRGFATEALRSVVKFCHDYVELNRIEAAVMHGNEASVRVLQRIGFAEEGVMRAYGYWKGAYHDLRIFSVLRPRSQT